MARALILYATTEGQTARIAERMAALLREGGHSVDVHRAEGGDAGPDPARFDGVIVGASIHYGRHPGHLKKLLRARRTALASRPNAFFSVSLSAGGPGAKPEAARRYVRKFLKQVRWQPQQSATLAGALQYSKYGAFKRSLMIVFVGLAGGDIDTARDYEYTDWNEVERFALAFAQQLS